MSSPEVVESAGAPGPPQGRAPRDEFTMAAESLLAALETGTGGLVRLLTEDPTSEPALTALADLALIASVIENQAPSDAGRALVDSLRAVLFQPARRPGDGTPGPEQWALHAARVWLDPICEGERVKQTPVGDLVARSGEIVLSLGPPWRAEEVAYVRACLDPTRPLPPLRRVPYDGTLQSIYELTHVVFYATDFGRSPVDARAAEETATIAEVIARGFAEWLSRPEAETLPEVHGWYDAGLELVLALRFLRGGWSADATRWLETIIPAHSEQALQVLRHRPDRFLSLYHPMAMAAMALALAQST